MVSWIDVTENRHAGRRSHLRPKYTLAEVTFPSNNAAEYIQHAQLLAMDYPNMLTAVAVRNKYAKNDLLQVKFSLSVRFRMEIVQFCI